MDQNLRQRHKCQRGQLMIIVHDSRQCGELICANFWRKIGWDKFRVTNFQIEKLCMCISVVFIAIYKIDNNPNVTFVPYVEAPINVPDCEARFNENGTVHWEPDEIVGLYRVRDPSKLKKRNGIDEELKLEKQDDDDNQIEGDRQGSETISVDGYNGSKKTLLPIHAPIKYIP
ncbi:MAG: hypothetical protein EZS28_028509 [Streblomastix strix]|uniref:Uncharacterized protein n=1 Tax=Streblomastix strix TaxID=222440 RepID=A0A5J4V1L1_9EUKA|nr:MAG: hypothetical protein EZS28_028509 [Streblomastix strix]